MEGKKKYVAIVLFLLIGLSLFTFANPQEEEKKLNDGKEDKEEVENTDSEKEEEKEDSSEKEEEYEFGYAECCSSVEYTYDANGNLKKRTTKSSFFLIFFYFLLLFPFCFHIL